MALAGVDLVLAQLHDRIVLPLRYPEAFTTRGVLLVGASGSGKSQAVRQLCYHHGLHLVTLTGADLVSSQVPSCLSRGSPLQYTVSVYREERW